MTAPELLTHREAAKFLRITSGTLHVWRAKGRYGIPYIQLGHGRVFYRPEDLTKFLDSCRVVPDEKSTTKRKPGRGVRQSQSTKRGSR